MNKLTELEVKFAASHVTTLAFEKWAKNRPIGATKFTHAVGTDTFFAKDCVVRFRRATTPDGNSPPVLTFKQRQSPGNIRDRFETDVFIDASRTDQEEVCRFLSSLGFERHFGILKESFIYHYEGVVSSGLYEVVIALYDIYDEATRNHTGQRFLEIEIDKHGSCDDIDAHLVLEDWIEAAQKELGVTQPLNQSLYEMFAPRNGLYLPETF